MEDIIATDEVTGIFEGLPVPALRQVRQRTPCRARALAYQPSLYL